MASWVALVGMVMLAGSPIHVAVRSGPSADGVAEFELRNASGKAIESLAEVALTLSPLDRKRRPLFDGRLFTSVDPNTGLFLDKVTQSSRPVLRLDRNERRVVTVRLLALRWSLSPHWVWQPRDFRELAGGGEYWLSAVLILFDPTVPSSRSPTQARVHIAEE